MIGTIAMVGRQRARSHRKVAGVAVVWALALAPLTAHAQQVGYTFAASTCTIASGNYSGLKFSDLINTINTAQGSAVGFKSGTGGFVLRCNVDPSGYYLGNGGLYSMDVTLIDDDGRANGGVVDVQFVQVSKATGAETTMAVVNSGTNGNTKPQSTAQVLSSTFPSPCARLLDFEDNYYYLRLQVSRTSTARDVRLFGVTLTLFNQACVR
jgi:hypothetical protein